MDDPERAVEEAAIDAAFSAEYDRLLGAVSESDTSVDLSTGAGRDPEAVSEDLSTDVAPDIRLHFDNDDYLAMISAELRRLGDAGMLDGLNVITDDPTRFATDEDVKERASGLYNSATRELYIAPEEVIGEEPRERKGRPGYFSTDKNFGSVWHELGHHRIRSENPDVDFEAMDGEEFWGQAVIEEFAVERYPDAEDEREARALLADDIEDEISIYANYGGMEYTAEVFAGLMAGEEYPGWVMDLYRRLHGPTPPEGVRNPETAYTPMVAPSADSGGVRSAVDAAIAGAVEAKATPEEIRAGIESLNGVHDINRTDFESEGSISFDFRLGRMERPTSVIYDTIKRRVESIIIRLPPLDPTLVREKREETNQRLFGVFQAADGQHHALPNHFDLLIAGPKGLTPHFEAMKAKEDRLWDFIDALTAEYMREFGEPGDLRDYPVGSGPADFADGIGEFSGDAAIAEGSFDEVWRDAVVNFDMMKMDTFEVRDEAEEILERHTEIADVRLGTYNADWLNHAGKRLKRLDENFDLSAIDMFSDTPEWGIPGSVAGYMMMDAGSTNDQVHVVVEDSAFFKPRITGVPEGEYLVGDDRLQTIAHEVAHYLHFLEFKRREDDPRRAWERYHDRLDSDEEEMLESEVSYYASTNAFEAVAEIATGLMYGHDFPDEVMELYERHAGPDVHEVDFDVLPHGEEPEQTGFVNPQQVEMNPWLREAEVVEDAFRRWAGVAQPDPGAGESGAGIAAQGDFGEWPWSRDKDGLKACEEEMEGEVDNQYAFCRAWANEAGFEYSAAVAAATDRIGSTLRRLGAAEINKVEKNDGGRTRVTYDFKWTGGGPTDSVKMFASTLVVKDGEMYQALLRMPPVPFDDWGGVSPGKKLRRFGEEIDDLRENVADVVERADPPVAFKVWDNIGHSNVGPTPHVNFSFADPDGTKDVGEFMSFLRRFKNEYQQEYPRAEFGVSVQMPKAVAATPSEWEPYEPGDEKFLSVGDMVAFGHDGERVIGEIVQMNDGLLGVDTPEERNLTIEVVEITEFKRDGDDLDSLRSELREHAENRGIDRHSSALAEYTDDNGYRMIQEHLRTVGANAAEDSPMYDENPRMETVSAILATMPEDDARAVENIQRAARMSLPRDMTVYRGVDVDAESFLDKAEAAMGSGKRLSDNGFQSATIDRDVAEGFGNVLLEIETDHGAYVRAASEFAAEDEVLLPAGTEYEVMNVDRDANTVHVRAHGGFDFGGVDVDFIREQMEENNLSYGEAVENVI